MEASGPSLEPNEVQVRKVGETVYGTVSSLANALEFPISILKDSARPDYWVPDHEISSCAVCDKDIGTTTPSSQVQSFGEIVPGIAISESLRALLNAYCLWTAWSGFGS